jgi:hypothetical protein
MSRTPRPRARAGLVMAAIVVAAVVVFQALLVSWFAWSAKNTAPRDLPVVVAGPPAVAGALADQLRGQRPGAFAVDTVPDAAAADRALRDRTAYAAFIPGPDGLALHVASAAGPTVSTLLTQATEEFAAGRPVAVLDVVPAPAADPHGGGFALAFLPLLITSVAAGAALLFVVRSHLARSVSLTAFALLAGLATAAAMHGLGVLSGAYLATAGVVGLLALAIAGTVSGLGAILGGAGIGLGALLVVFVGNPISGLTSAPELLPRPWGTVGQFLPPGAGASLLRSEAFFGGAGSARPLWVLAAWAAGGLALTLVGHYRDRRATTGPNAARVTDAEPDRLAVAP